MKPCTPKYTFLKIIPGNFSLSLTSFIDFIPGSKTYQKTGIKRRSVAEASVSVASFHSQASTGKWAPECDFYHVNDNYHLPSVNRHVCLMTYGYLIQKPSLWGLTVRSPDWCMSAPKHMLLITGKTHRVTLCPVPFDLQIYTQPVKQMARCFMQTWCFLTHWPFVKLSWKFLILSKVHR